MTMQAVTGCSHSPQHSRGHKACAIELACARVAATTVHGAGCEPLSAEGLVTSGACRSNRWFKN